MSDEATEPAEQIAQAFDNMGEQLRLMASSLAGRPSPERIAEARHTMYDMGDHARDAARRIREAN